MSRIFAAALLIAAMIVSITAPISAQAQQQTRVALVIGNSAYTGPHLSPLANPRNDAQDVAAALRLLGFTVYAHADLTARDMIAALDDFKLHALRADIALVYYAGHGMRDGDETYLLAADAAPTRASHLPLYALTLKQVLETLQGAQGLKVVVLDSCRDVGLVPFLQQQEIAAAGSWNRSGAHTRAAEIGRGVLRTAAPYDALIAFATTSGQVAADGQGQRNSPFTAALLRHLTDREEIGFIFRRVREAVIRVSRGSQRPEVIDAIGDRKYFLAGRVAVQRSAAQSQTSGSCAYVDTPAGFECSIENGRARFRRVAVAPTSQNAFVPSNLSVAQRAQRDYGCLTNSNKQGILFGERCWPLSTKRIVYNNIPTRIRRNIEDVTPLAGLIELQSLDLEATRVSDLSPLLELTKLIGLRAPDGRRYGSRHYTDTGNIVSTLPNEDYHASRNVMRAIRNWQLR